MYWSPVFSRTRAHSAMYSATCSRCYTGCEPAATTVRGAPTEGSPRPMGMRQKSGCKAMWIKCEDECPRRSEEIIGTDRQLRRDLPWKWMRPCCSAVWRRGRIFGTRKLQELVARLWRTKTRRSLLDLRDPGDMGLVRAGCSRPVLSSPMCLFPSCEQYYQLD